MEHERPIKKSQCCCGLLCRRQCLVPTWRGWLVAALGVVALAVLAFHTIYPFLAVNDPLPDGLLVVEGWTSDHGLEAMTAELRRRHPDKVYVIGGPLDVGGILANYKTLAELGAGSLIALGWSTNTVQAVPAPWVRQDRTYAAAVSLREWFHAHGLSPARIQLMSEGPHARRSRLMFEKAMGSGVSVGIINLPPRDFDPRHWWRSSQGVRTVVGEALAYGYARFLFRMPKEDGTEQQ